LRVKQQRGGKTEMKKLWLALIFFAGGLAHEVRNPVSCQCITAREFAGPDRKRRAG